MKLQHGFKSQAAALAEEVRVELGLTPFDRLDPHALAAHLDIPVVPLSELAAESAGAEYFLTAAQEAFSGLTVFDGARRIIVYNDSHPPARQNSDIAHEVSHALLMHEPTPALDSVTGCREWNGTREDEAAWLSGELLVTGNMALAIARGRFTESQARERLGVSARMLEWRLNMSGARKRAARERARRTPRRRTAGAPR